MKMLPQSLGGMSNCGLKTMPLTYGLSTWLTATCSIGNQATSLTNCCSACIYACMREVWSGFTSAASNAAGLAAVWQHQLCCSGRSSSVVWARLCRTARWSSPVDQDSRQSRRYPRTAGHWHCSWPPSVSESSLLKSSGLALTLIPNVVCHICCSAATSLSVSGEPLG